jgi:hypothetical protein
MAIVSNTHLSGDLIDLASRMSKNDRRFSTGMTPPHCPFRAIAENVMASCADSDRRRLHDVKTNSNEAGQGRAQTPNPTIKGGDFSG